MIGRSGFAGTTVRGIATEVGVSPALLLHHFRSKEGLRQACDDHVLAWYAAQVAEMARDDSPATVIGMIDRTPEVVPFASYIRRALIEGGAFARRIFDGLVAQAQAYLESAVATGRVRPTDDEHGRALLTVVISLAAQLLADFLVPPGTPQDAVIGAAADRLMLSGLELYTYGLFTDAGYLQAYRDYRSKHAGGPPTPEAGEDPRS